ncbi:MAG: hypothetical protein AAF560_30080 [Acidobacteriota bacterium]
MGLIRDVGGKLVQSFLSIDDLVLGQGLISEGRSQLGMTGRTVVGSIAAGSNIAVRSVHAGIQAGAKTAQATVSALDGLVPGAGLARSIAERVDEEATAAGEEASQTASYAVELTNRKVPRNPLSHEAWLSKSTPPGYGWRELAADTAVGSLARLATMPLTLGRDAAVMMSATPAGREIIDGSWKSLGVVLGLSPGSGSSTTELDSAELRETLMAVTTSSGDTAARNLMTFAEAAARLAFGDTRKLHAGLTEAIDLMRRIAQHEDLGEPVPAVPISEMLRQRAQRIVDHAPEDFLEALGPDLDGNSPTPSAVMAAILKDAAQLQIFFTEYPLALGLMGTQANASMALGMMDVEKIEGWVRQGDGATRQRPHSASHLETNLARAPEGGANETSVRIAQDTVFSYTSEVAGRRRALARIEELYGDEARRRIGADVSLDSRLRQLAATRRDAELRLKISAIDSARELNEHRRYCQEQVDSLRGFGDSLYGYRPQEIVERQGILETYLSLIDQDLALRGTAAPEAEERRAALRDFKAWANAANG